jgi:hypothetical protein
MAFYELRKMHRVEREGDYEWGMQMDMERGGRDISWSAGWTVLKNAIQGSLRMEIGTRFPEALFFPLPLYIHSEKAYESRSMQLLYISSEFGMPFEIRLINACLNRTVLKSMKTNVSLTHFLWMGHKQRCASSLLYFPASL